MRDYLLERVVGRGDLHRPAAGGVDAEPGPRRGADDAGLIVEPLPPAASILGYVGAGGLGLILNEKIGWREYDSVGMILLALFVTVFIIETISRAARKRLV